MKITINKIGQVTEIVDSVLICNASFLDKSYIKIILDESFTSDYTANMTYGNLSVMRSDGVYIYDLTMQKTTENEHTVFTYNVSDSSQIFAAKGPLQISAQLKSISGATLATVAVAAFVQYNIGIATQEEYDSVVAQIKAEQYDPLYENLTELQNVKSDIYYTEDTVVAVGDALVQDEIVAVLTGAVAGGYYRAITFTPALSSVISIMKLADGSFSIVVPQGVTYTLTTAKCTFTFGTEISKTITVASVTGDLYWRVPHDCEQNYTDLVSYKNGIAGGSIKVATALNSEKLNGKAENDLNVNSAVEDGAGQEIATTYAKQSDVALKQEVQTANDNANTAVTTANEAKDTADAATATAGEAATAASAATDTADRAYTVALGKQEALSYTDYSGFISAFNTAAKETYRTGQSIYIGTLDVPDLWIFSSETMSVAYTYTTDAAFIAALKTAPVQVGYYKISALETAKVDVEGTLKTSDIVDNLTSTATDKPLSANQGKVLNDLKVDKETGKALSSNDYTSAEKTKLADLPDDAGLDALFNAKQNLPTKRTNADIVDNKINVYNNNELYLTSITTLTLGFLFTVQGNSAIMAMDTGASISLTDLYGSPKWKGTHCADNIFTPQANYHYQILFWFSTPTAYYATVTGWALS